MIRSCLRSWLHCSWNLWQRQFYCSNQWCFSYFECKLRSRYNCKRCYSRWSHLGFGSCQQKAI